MRSKPAAAARTLALALLCAAVARPVCAQGLQPGRVAIEAVAAASNSSRAWDDPFVFLDLTTTVRVNERLDIIVRPWSRRLPGGDWDVMFYQAQIRYQPYSRLRFEAGIITSPLGLGTLELRQDVNPGVGSPFYYFGTLPVFDRAADRVTVLTGGYPLGAIASTSGSWWDARGGVVDGTPARYRKIFQNNGPKSAAQLVVGAGITPRPGMRFGVGLAHGAYRRDEDAEYYNVNDSSTLRDRNATVLNLEGEYAWRYTRLTGEWVRDRFESTTTPAIARGFYAQAVQTLSPRLFAMTRFTEVSAPVMVSGGRTRWKRSALEVSGGYRLTPDWTLKGGYERSRRYNVQNWSNAAVFSIVWAKRWF